MICVEIEIADDGSISVGQCPPEQEQGEKDYMNGVPNLDAALQAARAILQGGGDSASGEPDTNPSAGRVTFR